LDHVGRIKKAFIRIVCSHFSQVLIADASREACLLHHWCHESGCMEGRRRNNEK